ncbi:hypothetical protein MKK55_24155 [Methylobacterium sp. J-059]|uniref:hypothetical protein n=1 Tax=Methylobacterium sp. J-059 TaxID=2836643 RepID=UPI001FB86842|nr:hypothetical protein [Methylobacterium sp. J-059]MCJ2042025.1 hypothetical protein [Methylobacterium sp. J-059]
MRSESRRLSFPARGLLKAACRPERLGPAPVRGEAEAEADQSADAGEQADMLHLTGGQLAAPGAGRAVALHLDRERPDLELGRLGPRDVADEAAGQEADDQKDDLAV